MNTVAAAEALRLAAARGLDVEVVREAVLKGGGASHALATWPRRAALFHDRAAESRRSAPAVKDLDLAAAAGTASRVDMPLVRQAGKVLRSLSQS